MSSYRKNVAIMFSDIAGYTEIMGRDESKALDMISNYEKSIQQKVKNHGGQIVNFYGDGSLIVFDEIDRALSCSIEIQLEFTHILQIPIRIGVHYGTAVFQDGNAYGDAVNLASRIESMGQPGAVLCSEEAIDEIRLKEAFSKVELGDFHFKNVAHPMKIFALEVKGLNVPLKESLSGKLEQVQSRERSIAVLPFEHQSMNDEHKFYAEGISDEIRSQLLSIGELKVISRSSCMHYKGNQVEVKKVGEELQVSHVLEGRMQVIGEEFRLSCDLSDAKSNRYIWSLPPERRKVHDIFEFQNDVALAVVNELRVVLSNAEESQLNRIPTRSQDAYLLYQKGMDSLNRGHGNVEELSSALELFNKAINFDPKFAKAYQGIADTYVEQIFWGRSATSAVLGLAKEAANKALALDPASGEIYGVLGSIKFFEFEKSESREYLLKSIELSPSYLAGHERLALLYMSEMETEKAIACFRKAWELDPFSTKFIGQIGQAYYVAKRYEEGLTFLEKEQEKHPNDAWIQWMRSYVHTGMGEYQKAVDILTTRGTSGKNTNWLLGYNYGKLGKVKEAEAILSIHLQRRALDYVPAFMISAIYIGMDRMDEALEWVQRDLEDGAPGHVFMGHVDDPMYAQLRSDPRYLALDLPKFR